MNVRIVLLLMLAAGSAAQSGMPHESVAARLAEPRPLVIAHRGCWRESAENSLTGIRDCASLGVDLVEIDLRRTKDGIIVLLHDDTLDRTTSLSGPLRDKRYAELKSARLRRAAGGPDASLTEQRLPTFEEALTAAPGMFFFLDIKEPIHDEVLRLVEKHGARQRVLFSMNKDFGPALMQASFVGRAAIMPRLSEVFAGKCVTGSDPGPDIASYAKLNAAIYEVVFCDDRFLDRARVQARGTRLWVNSLNPIFDGGREERTALSDPDAVWGALLAGGATDLQTDYPKELIAYLRKTGKR